MNNDMNHATQVTNGMLYELIKDMKSDMNRRFEEVDRRFEEVDRRFDEQQVYMDRRFDEVDRRFEDIDRRFEEVDRRFVEMDGKINILTEKVDKNTNRIEEIYFNREKMKISFSRTFAFGTMAFSGLIAYVVALFGRN